jgi:hypothetical protein
MPMLQDIPHMIYGLVKKLADARGKLKKFVGKE